MKSLILKEKSDVKYVSLSQNYVVMIGSTFIKIYNTITNELLKINEKYPSNICISKDDHYMFYVRNDSNIIYVYDIFEKKLISKKIIMKNVYISFIHQYDNDCLFITVKSKRGGNIECHNSECIALLYYFEKDIVKKYDLDNMESVEYVPLYANNKVLYKINLHYNETDQYITKYYSFNDNGFKEANIDEKYCNNDITILNSKDEQYYAIMINKKKNPLDILLDSTQSKIKIVRKNNENVLIIQGRKFNVGMDVLKYFYRGFFVNDLENNNIFCTYYDNVIEMYNLENGNLKKVVLDIDIMDLYISFKNDYIVIQTFEPIYGHCQIYRLSHYLR